MSKTIIVDGQVIENVPDADPRVALGVADPVEALAAERASMVASRQHFAKACAEASVITWAAAIDWGPGNALPPAVDAALVAAIPDASDLGAARVDALSSLNIRRLHPIVELIRLALGLSPEQADAIFRRAIELQQQA